MSTSERERKRLPETKTLYEILPKGIEGGKEFARIVDLLRFHAARRQGRTAVVFSDVSGDYHGLDGFDEGGLRVEETTGYQYKFFPSPLSDSHRSEIKQSLERAAQTINKTQIRKWILVTPQDFIESATRRSGGDVSWFEGLKDAFRPTLELEHWGHRQLQALFIDTPSLCLFHYPELVPGGDGRRHTIGDTHRRYVDNLKEKYRHIVFVGLSVYKAETTRGVPMEQIYIPLSAAPDSASTGDPNVPRTNPLSFLVPGARHVVLGDPGSGKSTMLRFLALAGVSKALQERYQTQPDCRLPVVIILRRYADELQSRRNLSLS
jgi:hypothetical protein